MLAASLAVGVFGQDKKGQITNPAYHTTILSTSYNQMSNSVQILFTVPEIDGLMDIRIRRSLANDYYHNSAIYVESLYSDQDTVFIDETVSTETTYYYWIVPRDTNYVESDNIFDDGELVTTGIVAFDRYFGGDHNFPNFTNGDLEFADFNNDGRMDIVISGNRLYGYGDRQDSETRIYLNNGEGYSENTAMRTVLNGVSSSSIDVGDYDNDGNIDLIISGIFLESSIAEKAQVTTGDSITTTLYKGSGDGNFTEAASLHGIHEGAVKFADFNNDGFLDVFLTGFDEPYHGEPSSEDFVSKLYLNDKSGNFVDQNLAIPALALADASVGDYDNDGDMDIIVTGQGSSSFNPVVYLLENVNGILTQSSVFDGVDGFIDGSIEFGDYDSDGDMDVLATGFRGERGPATTLFTNSSGVFSSLKIDSIYNGEARFADYDNDGDLDFVVVGEVGEPVVIPQKNSNKLEIPSEGGVSTVVRFYRNDDKVYTNEDYLDEGYYGRSAAYVAWGDITGDGLLDLIYTGERFMEGGEFKHSEEFNNSSSAVYLENQFDVSDNEHPDTPDDDITALVTGTSVELSWYATTDTETAAEALTYNLYLRNLTLNQNIMMPHSTNFGFDRSVLKHGNVGQNLSWDIHDLPEGTYSWEVQAVDQNYASSSFTDAQTFVIDTTPPSVPSNFSAFQQHASMFLSWSTIPDIPDFLGYVIYVDGSAVDTITNRVQSFTTVSNLNIGQSYSFSLGAIDSHGNEALSPTIHTLEALDTEAPDQVDGFSAESRTNAVLLTWIVNTEPDFEAYLIYDDFLEEEEEEQAKRIPTPIDTIFDINTDSLLISGLVNGQEYDFSIAAMDSSGNISEFRSQTERPEDIDPPAMPQNFTAEALDKSALFRWDAISDADFAMYLLIEATQLPEQKTDLLKATQLELNVDTIFNSATDSLLKLNLKNDTTYVFALFAIDTAGNPSEVAGPIGVTPTNEHPTVVIALQDTTVLEDSAPLTFNWHDGFDDKETPDSLLGLAYSSPTNLVDISVEGSIVTITLRENLFGEETLFFTANDEAGQEVTQSFTLTITSVNDAPILLTGDNEPVVLNEDFTPFTVSLANDFSDVETAPEDLEYSLTGNNLVTITWNSDTTFTVSPVLNANGLDTVYLTATDEGGLSVTDTAVLTITPVNDMPVVTDPIGDLSLEEDFADMTYNLELVFDDVETSAADLAYSVNSSSVVNVSISEGIATISSIENANGLDTLFFTASDGDLSATDTVVVQVNSVDDYPVLNEPISDFTVAEDATTQMIDLSSVFSDADGAFSLGIYSQTSNALSDESSIVDGVLHLSLKQDAYGMDTVVIAATSLGKVLPISTKDTFIVTVTPVVDPVIISSIDVGENQLMVHWNASTESDTKGYILFRQVGEESPISSFVPATDTMLIITGLENNVEYAFSIRVSDMNDNLSLITGPVTATPLDMTAPEAINIASASDGDEKITVSWAASPESDFAKYYFYVGTSENPTTKYDSLSTQSATSHDITGLTNGTTYYVRMTAIDVNGNESEFSDNVSASPAGLELSAYFFQNQLIGDQVQFQFWSNIYLGGLPSFALTGPNGSVSIAQYGSTETKVMGSFKLDTVGTYTFTASASASNDRAANLTRTFTYSMVPALSATVVASADEALRVEFAAQAFSEETPVFVEENTENASYVLRASAPPQKKTRISLNYDKAEHPNADKLFIFRKTDGGWETIESQVYTKTGEVSAYVEELGEFMVDVDASFNGSNVVPESFAVGQNYPNPFNPTTTIAFDLPIDGHVRITIFNALGQKVRVIANEFMTAKRNRTVQWNGKNDRGAQVASGMYFYRVNAGHKTVTKKMILMK